MPFVAVFPLVGLVFVSTWEPRYELGPCCAGGAVVLGKGSDWLRLISEIGLSNCVSLIAIIQAPQLNQLHIPEGHKIILGAY